MNDAEHFIVNDAAFFASTDANQIMNWCRKVIKIDAKE
jgi:hypothetical protein